MRLVTLSPWPNRLYYIFLHYLINGKILKFTENEMCGLIFPTTFFLNYFSFYGEFSEITVYMYV